MNRITTTLTHRLSRALLRTKPITIMMHPRYLSASPHLYRMPESTEKLPEFEKIWELFNKTLIATIGSERAAAKDKEMKLVLEYDTKRKHDTSELQKHESALKQKEDSINTLLAQKDLLTQELLEEKDQSKILLESSLAMLKERDTLLLQSKNLELSLQELQGKCEPSYKYNPRYNLRGAIEYISTTATNIPPGINGVQERLVYMMTDDRRFRNISDQVAKHHELEKFDVCLSQARLYSTLLKLFDLTTLPDDISEGLIVDTTPYGQGTLNKHDGAAIETYLQYSRIPYTTIDYRGEHCYHMDDLMSFR